MLRVERLKVSVLNAGGLAFNLQLVLILIAVVATVVGVRLRANVVRRLNVLLTVNVVVGE